MPTDLENVLVLNKLLLRYFCMMLFTLASITEFVVNIDLIDSYKVAGALILPFSQANYHLATLLEGIQYGGCMYVSRSMCALSVS